MADILTLFHKGEPILREALNASVSIGSAADNDICLPDFVQEHHAKIETTPEGALLMEVDGPIFINGQRLVGSRALRAGDVFDLGDYRCHLHETSFREETRRSGEKTATASTQGEKAASATIPPFQFLNPIKKRFRRTRILIGRSETCDLVVDNPYVSSEHAEVFLHHGSYFLRDLHSRNGTFLNDYQVTEKQLPATGIIRLGRAPLSYEIEPSTQITEEEIEGIRLSANGATPGRMIIGKSRALHALLDRLKRIAPTNDSVLLLGETGVGKDLLSHYLHVENPKRRAQPFVIVNCATIPPNLADSQLFGHVKGSFTGAVTDHLGFFQQAHRGTLFLDEVGELPLDSQARLLRVMEDRLIRPVGGTRELSVDVRLVFATNKDLEEESERGHFRQDLYERFDWIFKVPPLRDRIEDIPPLVRHFVSQHTPSPLSIRPEVLSYLQSLEWKGNIRALNRGVRRAITNALSRGSQELEIEDFDLPHAGSSPASNRFQKPKASQIRRSKRETLEEVLRSCKGNISHAANQLGVSRVTIHAWIREDGIRLESFRRSATAPADTETR